MIIINFLIIILVCIITVNTVIYITYKEYQLSKSNIILILLTCLVAVEVSMMLQIISSVMN